MLTPDDERRLKSMFDRIVGLRREQRQIGSEISEIYKECKGLGYSTASMRDALKLAEMDPAEAAMRLDLDQIYYNIARGVAIVREVQPLNESPAWLAGRADALKGHREQASRYVNDPKEALEYQLGHDRGVELQQEAAAAIRPSRKRVKVVSRSPVIKRKRKGAPRASA